MVIFFVIVLLLFSFSLFLDRKEMIFSKQKTLLLKALLPVLLIFTHANIYVENPYIKQFQALGAPIVSLFLFISGYGLYTSYIEKGKVYFSSFFHKRMWKIAKPFLIVNILYVCIKLVIIDPSYHEQLNYFLNGLCMGRLPVFTTWYVVVLLIFYLAFYLIFNNKILKNSMKVWVLLFCVVIFNIILYGIHLDRCWWVSNLGFPLGVIYKHYLKIISYYFYRCYRFIIYFPLSILSICFILWLDVPILFSIAYIFICLLVVIPMSYIKDTNLMNNKTILFFSNISYELYLVHIVVLEVLHHTCIVNYSISLYLLLSVLISVLIAFIFKIVLKYENNILCCKK